MAASEQNRIWPGVALCAGLALVAGRLGAAWPVIGGAVFALVLGLSVSGLVRARPVLRPGTRLASRKVLQAAIVMLGGSLSLGQVVAAGRQTVAVMLVTLSAALLAAWAYGRLLTVPRRLMWLVGVGTAICGGSAIAAVAPILGADDDEIAFGISTVFLFNLLAVLVFPLVGHLLGLSQFGFGTWAGTAINDTSSVVAAGYAYGHAAGDVATITKLARTTMIVPVSLLFLWRARSGGTLEAGGDLRRVMPWFIFGFVAMALLNSTGWLGAGMPHVAGALGRALILVALAGVGLGTDLRKLTATGPRPVLLGLLVWVTVALTSLGVQGLARQW